MSSVSDNIRKQVEARLNECHEKVEKHFNVTIPRPRVSFDLSGTDAGTANYKRWHIRINPVLLSENLEDMLYETIPHEFGHLVASKLYPESLDPPEGKKRSVHGKKWKSIMHVMGVVPSRTHGYDTIATKRIRPGSVVYVCVDCSKRYVLGAKRHKRIQECPTAYWCKCTNRRGNLAEEGTCTVARKKTVSVQHTAKVDKCQVIMLANPDLPRAEMIQKFITEAECTPSSAASYYTLCKKRIKG